MRIARACYDEHLDSLLVVAPRGRGSNDSPPSYFKGERWKGRSSSRYMRCGAIVDAASTDRAARTSAEREASTSLVAATFARNDDAWLATLAQDRIPDEAAQQPSGYSVRVLRLAVVRALAA